MRERDSYQQSRRVRIGIKAGGRQHIGGSVDRSPAMVPRGGPRALHGDGLHGNQWRGGGGDFVRQCEARAFGNARGE